MVLNMQSEAPIGRSIVIGSSPSAVEEVYKLILCELEAKGYSQEDIFAVHLSLEEAFINAVKHGNKMESSKEVKIEYAVSADKVEISLSDEGGGFDPETVPDPRCGDNIYKTEGRGLFLIQSFMDKVEFNERGNSIRMVKYAGKSES